MTTFHDWPEHLPCLHCGTLSYARDRADARLSPVFCHDCTWQRIVVELGFAPNPAAWMTEQDVREAESA